MLRTRFALVLATALLGSASLSAITREPVAPPPALLEGVPDVVQTTDYSCGPSSLQAVLAYYGIAAREMDLVREARTNPAVGAELEDLAEVAERHGLRAAVRENMTMAELEREVRAGYPVIVLNQSWRDDRRIPWGRDWDDGHYVVVIGLDAGLVYVEDPVLVGARGLIPREEFVARWHDWTRDKRRAWGQALVVHGPVPPRQPRRIDHFQRVP
jgi:predicted double-glycine peptidase